MKCKHEPIREYDKESGVNVSEGKPRYWKCAKCGKKAQDIKEFK